MPAALGPSSGNRPTLAACSRRLPASTSAISNSRVAAKSGCPIEVMFVSGMFHSSFSEHSPAYAANRSGDWLSLKIVGSRIIIAPSVAGLTDGFRPGFFRACPLLWFRQSGSARTGRNVLAVQTERSEVLHTTCGLSRASRSRRRTLGRWLARWSEGWACYNTSHAEAEHVTIYTR
jgi:hypothetical protein